MTALNKITLKALAPFLLGVCLLFTLLTAFVLIPKANRIIEDLYIQDHETTLEIEIELLSRFVEYHRITLEDFANFPLITNAALLASADSADFVDLIENFVIAGEKSQLVVQDIAGDILYQTTIDLKGNFSSDEPWVNRLLNGEISSYFQLLGQDLSQISFMVSVPIKYGDSVEGILSAEITAPIERMFSVQTQTSGAAFRLTQNQISVQMDQTHILLPQEVSRDIAEHGVTLTYIYDGSILLGYQHQLRNIVLIVLVVGLAISFILFSFLAYRSISDDKEEVEHSSKHSPVNRQDYAVPIGVVLIGVLVSLAAFVMVRNLNEQKIQERILADIRMYSQEIKKEIQVNLETLHATKGFFMASDQVDRDEFRTFSEPLLKQHQDLQALEWIPAVQDTERKLYVQKARADGLSQFDITERQDQGSMVSASRRDIYFPVYYVEPMQGNEAALGFDLGSNSRRLAALDKARITGDLIATAPITLVQEKESQAGLLVFNPVYHLRPSFDSNGRREKQLQGFVLMVMRVGNSIEYALKDAPGSIDIYIEDVTDPENPEKIFGSSYDQEHAFSSTVISVADRQWKIYSIPDLASYHIQSAWVAWVALISGLVFTGFITYNFVGLIRRRQIIQGIVEQKTAALAQSEQQMRAVVENTVEGLITMSDDGRIESLNPACEKIFGYDLEKALNENIQMLIPELHGGELEEFVATAYSDSGKLLVSNDYNEIKGKRSDGSLFPIEFSISKVQLEQRTLYSGIVRDITQRKQAEEELLRSNIELERFAYVASHDLQEPLRMVTNFTGLLRRYYEDQLDDRAKEFMTIASDSAERMQDLIGDLLEYARIGHEAERFEDTDINEVLELIKENLRDSIDASGAKITCGFLPSIRTNPIRLVRLLQNLVGNSLKYQKMDSMPEIHISAEQKDDAWVLSVTDNGIGMKQEYCEKIFEPFKRLHGRDEYLGTGMGLAICRKIVEGFGGKIWAESQLDQGSTFYFTLPIQSASLMQAS